MLCHSLHRRYEQWPEWDESLLVSDSYVLPVQINGKMRGKVEIPADASQDSAIEAALSLANVGKQVDGKEIFKVIFVPKKILNLIVK